MARIPEETIQQVIEANDIVDVITGYVPDLKRAGTSFKACCPFHVERTPSFNVTPSRQFFKCFGCGEAGNVLGFVMKMENLPFPDAVRKLASRVNIPIIEEAETATQVAARKSKSRIIELHNDFTQFMHERLLKDQNAQHARDYLKSREFNSQMAKNWLVGWHPESSAPVIEWAKEKGYKARELVEAGIASTSDDPRRGLYYRFKDRLMFPIHNDYGDVVAFSGRQLREDPRSGKYINSPETPIFKKSKVFFGLDKARKNIPKQGYALLCEGHIDVISCHENGFPFTIATQGTACTAEHAAILKRYCKKVILCFDSDAAGQKATQTAFVELARVGLQVQVVSLPEGDDPDSLIKAQGANAFQALIDASLEFFDYKIRYESTKRNLENPGEKAQVASEMSELLAAMSDTFQLQASLSFIATRLGMSEDDIRNASRLQKRKDSRIQSRQSALRERDANEQVMPLPIHDDLAALCHINMNYPEAFEWMQEQLEPLLTASEAVQGYKVFETVLTAQPKPVSASVVQAFLETVPEEIKLTLAPLYGFVHPDRAVAKVSHPLQEAQAYFKSLSMAHLERLRKSLTSQLASPDLSQNAQTALQHEIHQILNTLKEVRKS